MLDCAEVVAGSVVEAVAERAHAPTIRASTRPLQVSPSDTVRGAKYARSRDGGGWRRSLARPARIPLIWADWVTGRGRRRLIGRSRNEGVRGSSPRVGFLEISCVQHPAHTRQTQTGAGLRHSRRGRVRGDDPELAASRRIEVRASSSARTASSTTPSRARRGLGGTAPGPRRRTSPEPHRAE